MNKEDRLICALNELADIEKQKRKNAEDASKREEEAAERRKRLKDYFYKKAAPISMHIPKDSLLTDLKGEEQNKI